MLDHLLNKKVGVSVALNSNIVMGVTDYIKGVLVEFDDKFLKLDDGTVISLQYVRFIKAA